MRGTDRRRARRARRHAAIAAAAAIGLSVAACSSGPTPPPAQAGASASARAAVPAAELKITPANGSRDVNPARGVTVSATTGQVTSVTVSTSGDPVSGTLTRGGTTWRWHSSWALHTSQDYMVTATGTGAGGRKITATSTFRILAPAQTFQTEIYEGADQTYGVGMPIMLTFSQPITNRAAVERSLELTTSKPVIGAWYWDGNEQVDFRPRDYWPAGTTVSFDGHLNGVEGASGVYGTADLTQTFTIGDSIIAVASTTVHHTQIYINGARAYDWPISTGRPSLPTPDGTYLSVQKNNPVRMIGGGPPGSPGYYNELVYYAVRFTFSGDYYHSAPWSVVDQGTTNVSHGCVNLPPEDASTYYDLSVPGDPITVTASTAAGKWDDGWTEWFLTFSQYLRGSALGQAVEAGPTGSQFVSPVSLPPDTAAAPLGTSEAGNYDVGTANIAS